MEQVKDSLTKELEAMAMIGRVLGDLTDPAVRSRVLRWAAERFGAESVLQQHVVAAPRADTSTVADPDLSVDSLTEIFETPRPYVADLVADDVVEKKQPLESVLRSFADELRALAEEWNGAAA